MTGRSTARSRYVPLSARPMTTARALVSGRRPNYNVADAPRTIREEKGGLLTVPPPVLEHISEAQPQAEAQPLPLPTPAALESGETAQADRVEEKGPEQEEEEGRSLGGQRTARPQVEMKRLPLEQLGMRPFTADGHG